MEAMYGLHVNNAHDENKKMMPHAALHVNNRFIIQEEATCGSAREI